MGNKSLFPCYSQDLPSNRNILEEIGFASHGPVKATRKKFSIATSETISIQPLHVSTDRSSVTEFVVNKSESSTDCIGKSIDRSNSVFVSTPYSPARYQRNEAYSRNVRNQTGVNLVKQVRSKSLMASPQIKKNYNQVYDNKRLISSDEVKKRLSKINSRRLNETKYT